MANSIRIKRRITGSAGAPGTLAVGELAYNEMDSTLYIGTHNNGTPQAVPVAGLGEFVRLSNVNQTINGLKTFSQHPVISETQLGTSENSTKVATTAWVKSLGYTNNAGTVTSVGLSLPSFITVSNSPVTGSGTLTGVLATQSATHVFAGPTSGGVAAPTFRALEATDIPSLTASKISDFNTQVRTSRLDQMAAPTADVNLNNRKIVGLAEPEAHTDAATKGYVDSVVQGLHPKPAVKAATISNIASLSGALTVDGVSLVAGDRVLVKDQTAAAQNGIYVVASGAWTRAADADIWNELISAYVFVQQGATNADDGFICTVDAGGTLGTTNVTWEIFTSANQIDAGAGLTKTGTVIDVVGTADRITVNVDNVDIASTYVGQTSITTLGTIATGTWNATTIGVGKGGTGVTSLTTNGILYGGATVGATAQGTWDSTNSIGQLLSHNSSGVPVWTDTIDGGTF